MISKMKEKFLNWSLDRKIYFVVKALAFAISIIMLAVFSTFFISSYINQSNSIAGDQLYSIAVNEASALDSYKELVEALTIDDAIQEYLKSDGPTDPRYFDLVTNTKNTFQNAQNMYSDLMFIAVVSSRFDDVQYKGALSKISTNFMQKYTKDYAECLFCRETGTLRMSYNDTYMGGGHKLLNVYFPVYSISNMIHENGVLVMIFDGSLFQRLAPDKKAFKYNSDLILVDSTGSVISGSDQSLIGQRFAYANEFESASGNFRRNSHLYIYRKIGKWNYYLVSRIPLMDMYRDSLVLLLLLLAIGVVVTYLGQLICKRIIQRAYKPLDHVVLMMNSVAQGKLDIRINLEKVGIDFIKLADGFNFMLDKINTLMEQVRLDSKLNEQLRLSALQSQIQPHFLYNALDCIHWQASADGSEEISVFVKALAQYYRICLSKGEDVIFLEQEIEHVENYLIIQNIRYDNIVCSTIEVEEDCRKILIPKITLQPLVENSIYHGIKIKEGRRGELAIRAFRSGEDVLIQVSDNGTGMTEEQIDRMNNSISEYNKDFGYGIRNVNKRIEILFGKEYGLRYARNEANGVTVTIRLPGGVIRNMEEVLICTKP